jgi:hypothetical protein
LRALARSARSATCDFPLEIARIYFEIFGFFILARCAPERSKAQRELLS